MWGCGVGLWGGLVGGGGSGWWGFEAEVLWRVEAKRWSLFHAPSGLRYILRMGKARRARRDGGGHAKLPGLDPRDRDSDCVYLSFVVCL